MIVLEVPRLFERRMPDMETPFLSRSPRTKSPRASFPTLPHADDPMPSRARHVATFAAHPPVSSRKSFVAQSSPAAGSEGSLGTNVSATSTPAQRTRMGRGLAFDIEHPSRESSHYVT